MTFISVSPSVSMQSVCRSQSHWQRYHLHYPVVSSGEGASGSRAEPVGWALLWGWESRKEKTVHPFPRIETEQLLCIFRNVLWGQRSFAKSHHMGLASLTGNEWWEVGSPSQLDAASVLTWLRPNSWAVVFLSVKHLLNSLLENFGLEYLKWQFNFLIVVTYTKNLPFSPFLGV